MSLLKKDDRPRQGLIILLVVGTLGVIVVSLAYVFLWCPPHVWMNVETTPPGAEIRLNDELVGITPFRIDIGRYYRPDFSCWSGYWYRVFPESFPCPFPSPHGVMIWNSSQIGLDFWEDLPGWHADHLALNASLGEWGCNVYDFEASPLKPEMGVFQRSAEFSLKARFADMTSPDVRRAALRAYAERGRNSIPLLTKHLSDADAYVRVAALFALTEAGGEETVPLVLGHLKQDKDLSGWETVFPVLVKKEAASSEQVFRQLLADSDWHVRETVLQSLSRRQIGLLGPLIQPLLKDPVSQVRCAAAHVYFRSGDPSCAPSLVALLHNDEQEARQVLEDLSSLNDRSLAPALAARLAEERAKKISSPQTYSAALSSVLVETLGRFVGQYFEDDGKALDWWQVHQHDSEFEIK